MRSVKPFADALRVFVGFAEAARGTMEVTEDGVDCSRGKVGWEAFPCAIGDCCDHGGSGGMTHALVEPKYVSKELLLGWTRKTCGFACIDGGVV